MRGRERTRIRQSTTARIHFVKAENVGDISIFFARARENLIQRACCEKDRPRVDTESHVSSVDVTQQSSAKERKKKKRRKKGGEDQRKRSRGSDSSE